MDESQKKLKIELIKTAKSIRKKFKNLHDDQLATQEKMEERYQPITQSLKSVLHSQTDEKIKTKSDIDDTDYDEYEKKIDENDNEFEDTQDFENYDESPDAKFVFKPTKLTYSDELLKQESISPNGVPTSVRNNNEHVLNLSEYFDNLLTKNSDPQYGIRRARGVLKIGDSEVRLDNQNLNVRSKTFEHTKGLLNLLFYKKPENYTISDLENYKKNSVVENGSMLEARSEHQKKAINIKQ